MITLGIEARVRLLHDLVCLFLPWNGDAFRELCGGREYPPEHCRLQPLQDLFLIADRFLYQKNENNGNNRKNGNNPWTLLAFDKVSWESFFSDTQLQKSRKPAAKAALGSLREQYDDILEHCRFDEKCHRELELRRLQESRKRSPRITARSARNEALQRLRTSTTAKKDKVLYNEESGRSSREERMAKREQLKVLQQLRNGKSESEIDHLNFSSSNMSSDDDYFCVDDEHLVSNNSMPSCGIDGDEEEFINVTNVSSPVKKVILKFNDTIQSNHIKETAQQELVEELVDVTKVQEDIPNVLEETEPVMIKSDLTRFDLDGSNMLDALIHAATSSDPIPSDPTAE